MDQERKGAVTFKGNPLTLIGPALQVGGKAPDFTVLAGDLTPFTLGSTAGKTRLITAVPSLDTPICDAETRRFNEEAAKLPGHITVLTISMDLPFAQNRFCSTAGVKSLQVLSDHRDASFGKAYGVLIQELRLLARSVFIVDPSDRIQYIEIVKEVASHPNYEAALNSLKQIANT